MKKLLAALVALSLLICAATALASDNPEEITLGGDTYALPCRVSAFLENGWEVGPLYQEWINNDTQDYVELELTATDAVPANHWGNFVINRDGTSLTLYVEVTQQDEALRDKWVDTIYFIGPEVDGNAPEMEYLGTELLHPDMAVLGKNAGAWSEEMPEGGEDYFYAWMTTTHGTMNLSLYTLEDGSLLDGTLNIGLAH